VASSQKILDEYNELSMKLAVPDISDDEMTKTMENMEKLNDKIEAGNLWELDRTVSRAMEALRLPPGDAKTAVLSGGEKRRVSLCMLLLSNHDMLLLDEPTNHLDSESIEWLEQFLAEFKGTVVCITHDRYVLQNVAQWILELDRGKGIPFEGNYSAWLEAKNNRLEAEKKQQSAAAKAVAAELEWIRSNPKAKGNKSKARLNRYEELLAAAAPKELRNAGQIYIPPGPRLGDIVINVENLHKSFECVHTVHIRHFGCG
jgi:ATPase subunit of ABC transporter with duplicated ATPase domains